MTKLTCLDLFSFVRKVLSVIPCKTPQLICGLTEKLWVCVGNSAHVNFWSVDTCITIQLTYTHTLHYIYCTLHYILHYIHTLHFTIAL